MEKYHPINGWTKIKIKAHIDSNFVGKSMNNVVCAYRGNDGTKCAVGLFIPDDKYDPSMDNPNYMSIACQYFSTGVISLLTVFPEIQQFMPLPKTAMVTLQSIHDDEFYGNTRTTERIKQDLLDWVEQNIEDEVTT